MKHAVRHIHFVGIGGVGIEEEHEPLVGDRTHDALDLGGQQLDLGL